MGKGTEKEDKEKARTGSKTGHSAGCTMKGIRTELHTL